MTDGAVDWLRSGGILAELRRWVAEGNFRHREMLAWARRLAHFLVSDDIVGGHVVSGPQNAHQAFHRLHLSGRWRRIFEIPHQHNANPLLVVNLGRRLGMGALFQRRRFIKRLFLYFVI